MLCSERKCKTDIENHLLSYHLSKYTGLVAGLVNSWTPKESGIAWWGSQDDKTDLPAPSPFGKEKTAVKSRVATTIIICQKLHT